MSIILFCWLLYVGSIVWYQPQKQSLRDTSKLSFKERFFKAKGTLFLGTLLFGISAFTLGFRKGLEIPREFAVLFGYVPDLFFHYGFLWQPFTSLFVHFNLIHLVGNLSLLQLLSAYERRVALKRYLTVYFIAGLGASVIELILSALIFGTQARYVSMGASGAICGLIAAYYLDTGEKPSLGDWIKSVLILMVLITFLSVMPNSHYETKMQVDWFAHLVGALIACFYIRFWPSSAP